MADKKNGTQGRAPATGDRGGYRSRCSSLKAEAVRRAMTERRAVASPGRTSRDTVPRQKFGIKIGLDHISNWKGELAKRAAKATTPAGSESAPAKSAAGPAASGKPSAPESRAAQSTPVAHTRAVGGNWSSRASILLEDVLTAKILIDRVGAGPLKTLIDGLAK